MTDSPQVAEDVEPCPICQSQSGVFAVPRHTAKWSELSIIEQSAILQMISDALASGGTDFHASEEHGHFHFQLNRTLTPAPKLSTGSNDPLLPLVTEGLDRADSVDLAVAFAMSSGVQLLEPWLRDLLQRGGHLRIIVGDYLDITEPEALQRLMDLDGARLYIFEASGSSFHPKTWLFRAKQQHGSVIVGSSNLSKTALTTGVEWNLHTENATDEVAAAFDTLLAHPNVKILTNSWIEQYIARRQSSSLKTIAQKIIADEPLPAAVHPHHIQEEALSALKDSRARGQRAGLVVLATGLGKTWLAAFDSLSFHRILFVAHREEILNQAINSFRRIRPDSSIGRYNASHKDMHADIVFASVQTIGKQSHLRNFPSNSFDYIVVDEFHHAAASSYLNLLNHFSPQYLLGLTATPDRTDGADLLPLCDNNLVYQCDLFEGIDANLLAPFHYFGVPDEVDYGQIPWRSNQFDPDALDAALATEARAANALDQFRKHRQGPAIGFCCSVRHAKFMSQFFQSHGIDAVAVHSGADSAPRTTSLEKLGRGEIDIIFSVDMFNEGVDVPNIGTVIMLRPTESAIIWLQQLGRGLRKVEGKTLQVIDYIGNHRIFLTKLRALLSAGPGDRSLSVKLDQVLNGTLPLPANCHVTYDLKTIEILRELLQPKPYTADLEAQYKDYHLRHGKRPTATQVANMGFDPINNGHGGWFDFVRDMGDSVDATAYWHILSLIRQLERDKVIPEVAISALLSLNPYHPATSIGLEFWRDSPFLRRKGDGLALTHPDPRGAATGMLLELAEWRANSSERNTNREPTNTNPSGALTLWREYPREEIPAFFGTSFNPGNWNAGIVRTGNTLILLTTLNKGSLSSGNEYEDHFHDAYSMQWQSQNQTRKDSLIGRILNGTESNTVVHLFVRFNKLRNGKAAPFIYCGTPLFVSWNGERPITVQWQLEKPIPRHLWPVFDISEDRVSNKDS